MAIIHVPVECVVTGVHLSRRKPAVVGWIRIIEDSVPAFKPVDIFGRFCPEVRYVVQ